MSQSAGDGAERRTAPKQKNGADDDEQLHELIAGDGPAQDIRPARPKPLAVLKIRMNDARHGQTERELTPLLRPKVLFAERK
jgi:hypothetical protein